MIGTMKLLLVTLSAVLGLAVGNHVFHGQFTGKFPKTFFMFGVHVVNAAF